MSQNVTLYNLLISCPGDVKDEVTIIESAVEEFNELYAEPLGITIKTRHWGKSSYAQSGGKPQALLNEQFVNKCDAAVAIMWTKFGSPTDDYGSGTEEEIEIMLQSGKQVFMYFSDKPLPPSKMNEDGYKQIQAFREKYNLKALFDLFKSKKVTDPSHVYDDEAKWDRVPTKIKMNEVLSVDLQPQTYYTPDKEEK